MSGPRGRTDGERASIALTAMVAAFVGAAMACLLVVVTADVLRTRAVAQTAADAAALAAVGASPLVRSAPLAAVGDTQHAAAAAAEANGARLVRCECGMVDEAEVATAAEPRLAWVRRVIGTLGATARAELVPVPVSGPGSPDAPRT